MPWRRPTASWPRWWSARPSRTWPGRWRTAASATCWRSWRRCRGRRWWWRAATAACSSWSTSGRGSSPTCSARWRCATRPSRWCSATRARSPRSGPSGSSAPPPPSSGERLGDEALLLVAEPDPEPAAGADHLVVGRDGPYLAGAVRHRHGGDLHALADHHLAVAALGEHPHGRRPEAGGQDPVERRRHAAPLQVAEHHHAGVLAGHLADLAGDVGADAAERAGGLLVEPAAAALHGALGADHDREAGAAELAGRDRGGDRLDGERDLRDEDDVGAAAQA